MRAILSTLCFAACFSAASAQTPKSYTSSEILLQLKKLNVLGSVLYIAAHPDDENTRLLAYLANEKLYRTGYLSLTRGDGGQNLIGDEQGVDLGLIRTQELLAARRIDGAEQFFSRAFDFGFSKSPEEAMRIWDHDKILSDVVWVIRKFRPDVIITRFPTTGEGGHGHHTASAILAGEAFDAAADPTKFPEQLQQGVTVWQAKRLLWNTFNFGNTNTQDESQFKMDCGDYNAVLGKSYGEIAAASRSQHKSQGFGVPAQRGSVLEYFKTIKGDAPQASLMDGINTGWDRVLTGGELTSRPVNEDNAQRLIDSIVNNFSIEHPERSLPALVRLHKKISTTGNAYWREQKLSGLEKIIEQCAGLFIDATVSNEYAVQGDSLKISLLINNRLGADITEAGVHTGSADIGFGRLGKNVNAVQNYTMYIKPSAALTQPYWLQYPKSKGSFDVRDQQLIGKAENDPLSVEFFMNINGEPFRFSKPIRYKYTDPVKGELYQPLMIIPSFSVRAVPEIAVNRLEYELEVRSFKDHHIFRATYAKGKPVSPNAGVLLNKGDATKIKIQLKEGVTGEGINTLTDTAYDADHYPYLELHQIRYDHIPTIAYTKPAAFTAKLTDVKIEGNYIGYIPGAGDKVPEALHQMGYKVVQLKESDLTAANLRQFDAIVTGVRAYNTNEWLSSSYEGLMQYVREGGVLLVQYNTNNSIGPVKAKISPYPFTISRNRITDEEAKVNFLLPEHKALNYPNKITAKDFEGWIQERSIYNAEGIDTAYRRILSMKDPGEAEQDGSLIIANYGKGRFVYTGLVFFRELPAGVTGSYRLFANLIANKRSRYIK